MIYILDENGNIKIGTNGHPMVDPENGSAPHELDAIGGAARITALNSESANHRKTAAGYKATLDKIPEEVRNNPEAAIKAISTVSTLDDKLKADMEKVRSEVTESFQSSIQEKDEKIKMLSNGLNAEKIGGKFAMTEVLKATTMHPAVAKSHFESHFSLDENNNVVATGYDGKQIFSKVNPGTPASFDEALGTLIETSPLKDHLLKSDVGHGGGSRSDGAAPLSKDATAHDNIKAGVADLLK